MDYEKFLRSYRKKPIYDIADLPTSLDANRDDIKKIIPQRDPVLLIDSLIGLDLDTGVLAGRRKIPADDPVFSGHFPDYPMYPGTYTLEMIGQLSLCLYHFLDSNQSTITDQAKPIAARATRIIGAFFLEPILPGHEVVLLAKKIEYDGFLATAVGQAIYDGKVCCISAGEAAIL